MEYRLLGRSGLKISTLTLGTMTFGGKGAFAKVGNLGVQEARRLVDSASTPASISSTPPTSIRPAPARRSSARAWAASGRTTCWSPPRRAFRCRIDPNDRSLSRYHLVRACEASLKRLKTDVIDLYQVHEWDGQTPLEETLDALDLLVRQGKVRYVGCSNYSGWHLMKALGISTAEHKQRFVSQQIHYTLEARDAEYELVPISIDQGLGILVWSPLAGGLLSGKHRKNQKAPAGTRQLAGWDEPPIRDEERLWRIVDTLVEVGKAHNVSAAQAALAWLLGRPAVTSVIIGGRTEAQISDNLAAAGLSLSAEERQRLDEVSAPPILYPYWHQLRTASDRFGPADLSLLGPSLKQ